MMADEDFSDEIKQKAFRSAGSQCECVAGCKEHPGTRCKAYFWRWDEAHYYPIDPARPPVYENCRVMCLRCHRNAEASALNSKS